MLSVQPRKVTQKWADSQQQQAACRRYTSGQLGAAFFSYSSLTAVDEVRAGDGRFDGDRFAGDRFAGDRFAGDRFVGDCLGEAPSPSLSPAARFAAFSALSAAKIE